MACTITDSIAQCRGLVIPLMPKSGPRRSLGAKFDSHSERLAIMKSNKVDSVTKMVLRPTPSTAETDSSVGKEEATRVGNCEKSIKPASGEATEICVLLKLGLLEDMDVCAKYSKVAKKVAKNMVAKAYSSADEIKRLDSELVALKGSNIYTSTSLQLKTAHQDIIDLKTKLDAIQVGAAEGEVLDDATAKSVAAAECVVTE
ncbi:hypothetical protein ACFX2H_006508 [Malus domestica]